VLEVLDAELDGFFPPPEGVEALQLHPPEHTHKQAQAMRQKNEGVSVRGGLVNKRSPTGGEEWRAEVFGKGMIAHLADTVYM